MAYDASKDQVLGSWENKETGLTVSIYRYGEGDPKLQIGPRTYTKKDGTKGKTKPGRLTMDDVLWLYEIIDEIKDKMTGLFLEEGKEEE
ncbi:MAG: hypothetical protein J7J52_06170 [Deltaproteobacteria bacterium]|nr:hypothetical protein [Deltaproteobacteria bacterium]